MKPRTPIAAAGGTLWRPELLNRLEFLLLLTAVTVAVLIYPLALAGDWVQALDAWGRENSLAGRLAREQLFALCAGYFSVLILKGVLAAVPALGFVAARVVRRLMAPETLAPAPEGRRVGLGLAAFFAWAALSAAWSPTPALSREAAVWVLAFGAFIYALLRRGLSLREMRLLAHYLLALGLVAMAITFLEALPPDFPLLGGKIFLFLSRSENIRNRYGSLLGHNTAVASFLMITAFPCFSLLLSAATRKGRAFYGAYLALVMLAVLVVQSRAIWVLLPLLGLLAMRSGLRARGVGPRLRWLPTWVLALLALCLATQIIDRPWNPFYIRDNPLGRRIRDLSAAGLKGEARLRLNVISAALVAERPWIGHGLFAFQYVYPARQAEYFAQHPDSWLNRTRDRSNMAHDEYMQVAVDHGLLGLGLLGWGLWAIAARGWRRRRALDGAPRLLHEGFGWSALGFALHALVDFPFHLPMLALPGVACLAAWGACRERLEPPAGSPAPEEAGHATRATFRPWVFARLLGAFMALLLVPLGTYPLIRCLQGDVYARRGEAAMESYRNTPDPAAKIRNLNEAFVSYMTARDLTPYNSLMLLELADVCQRLAEASADLSAGQARQRQPQEAATSAKTAGQFLKLGFDTLAQASRGINYHALYEMRASLYRTQSKLEPQGGADARYRENMEKAIYFCPAMGEYIASLLLWLERRPSPDQEKIQQLRRRLLQTSPDIFRKIYIEPANTAFREWRYARAAAMWEEILKADPKNTVFLNTVARASLMAGNRKRALEVVELLYKIDDTSLIGQGGIIAKLAINDDFAGMELLLRCTGLPETEHAVRADFRSIEIEMRRRQNRNPEPAIIKPPKDMNEASWALALAEARPAVLFHYFNDPKEARRALNERLALKGGAPGIRFWIEGFYIAEALQDLPLMGRCLAEARALNAKAPAGESKAATLADLAGRTMPAPEKQRGPSTKTGELPIGNKE